MYRVKNCILEWICPIYAAGDQKQLSEGELNNLAGGARSQDKSFPVGRSVVRWDESARVGWKWDKQFYLELAQLHCHNTRQL